MHTTLEPSCNTIKAHTAKHGYGFIDSCLTFQYENDGLIRGKHPTGKSLKVTCYVNIPGSRDVCPSKGEIVPTIEKGDSFLCKLIHFSRRERFWDRQLIQPHWPPPVNIG